MAYIEKKIIKGKSYYYLTKSSRTGTRFKKKRKYLGTTIPKDIRHLKTRSPRLAKKLTKREAQFIDSIKRSYLRSHHMDKSLWRTERSRFIDFIYNTNAIEGSTVTREETEKILKTKTILKGKAKDAQETKNMKECIDLLFDYKGDISEEFILKLHALQHKETLADAGAFRDVDVRVGSYLCPRWQDLPRLMQRFIRWYAQAKKILHPFELAALVHLKFVKIHPFRDGNGRISRLLMNFVLLRQGYPLLNIFNDEKMLYYLVLQKHDFNKKDRGFVRYIFEVFLMEYKEYL